MLSSRSFFFEQMGNCVSTAADYMQNKEPDITMTLPYPQSYYAAYGAGDCLAAYQMLNDDTNHCSGLMLANLPPPAEQLRYSMEKTNKCRKIPPDSDSSMNSVETKDTESCTSRCSRYQLAKRQVLHVSSVLGMEGTNSRNAFSWSEDLENRTPLETFDKLVRFPGRRSFLDTSRREFYNRHQSEHKNLNNLLSYRRHRFDVSPERQSYDLSI